MTTELVKVNCPYCNGTGKSSMGFIESTCVKCEGEKVMYAERKQVYNDATASITISAVGSTIDDANTYVLPPDSAVHIQLKDNNYVTESITNIEEKADVDQNTSTKVHKSKHVSKYK